MNWNAQFFLFFLFVFGVCLSGRFVLCFRIQCLGWMRQDGIGMLGVCHDGLFNGIALGDLLIELGLWVKYCTILATKFVGTSCDM
ncbi:hypothetical protein L873DRAFT_482190 [Choiromyces venosus 120613-1]|uniref:Uncharacterized protein n=1 Tax=Choiromyces venosus 120613-1 TaxID=1336337 RepID=A0A3N4JUP8_9PEZI|nr:hypothetical protein L873DRAFT_482190 [Choiromyces venosus 120613-1]